MKHFFLFATYALTEKLYFFVSMATIVNEKNSFNTIMQFINPKYPWTNGVKQRKIVAKVYLLP